MQCPQAGASDQAGRRARPCASSRFVSPGLPGGGVRRAQHFVYCTPSIAWAHRLRGLFPTLEPCEEPRRVGPWLIAAMVSPVRVRLAPPKGRPCKEALLHIQRPSIASASVCVALRPRRPLRSTEARSDKDFVRDFAQRRRWISAPAPSRRCTSGATPASTACCPPAGALERPRPVGARRAARLLPAPARESARPTGGSASRGSSRRSVVGTPSVAASHRAQT
jgi:hypothetical protein